MPRFERTDGLRWSRRMAESEVATRTTGAKPDQRLDTIMADLGHSVLRKI